MRWSAPARPAAARSLTMLPAEAILYIVHVSKRFLGVEGLPHHDGTAPDSEPIRESVWARFFAKRPCGVQAKPLYGWRGQSR